MNLKKHILLISHVMPIPTSAGNEMRILKLLSFLKSKGFSVIYLLNQTHADQSAVLKLKEYVEEVFITDTENLTIDKKIVSSSIEFLSNKNQVKKNLCPPELVYLTSILAKKYKPVAAIAEYIFTSPCLEVISSDILKIIDAHDMFSRRSNEEALYCTPEEEREYILKCDLLMAIQPHEAELFSRNIPERKIISVGIDYELDSKILKNKTNSNSVFVIGSDNIPNVIGFRDFCAGAWHKVLQAVPNAQLRVAGNICNKIICDDKSIKLLGLIGDLKSEYSNAAVVINPTSIGTGLKIKTVEALCNGKAFVGTPNSIEGLPESKQKAFLKCEDWDEFANSIITLLRSNDKRQALETEAFNYAKLHFNAETVYKPLLKEINHHVEELDEIKSTCPVCKLGKFKRFGDLHWNIWGEEYHLVKCVECESIFTNPLPSDETLGKFYATEFNYNWYRDHYGAKLLDCQSRIQEYKNHLGKRVLDFGGGLGYFSQVARSEGYHSITFDPYVENTKIPEKNWDSIVSLHVLEHSNDLDKTISQIKEYLKPGGNIILVVPNAKSDGYKKQGMNWVWAQPPILHLFHFTAKGLKLLFERNGMLVDGISYHERWDANLYTDLEKANEFQSMDAEWGNKEINKNVADRALTAWRNSSLRVKGLEIALQNYDPSNEKYAELQIIARKEKTNHCRVGLINNKTYFEHDTDTVCFSISKYDLSFNQIMYSSFSTPARYIMEIFARLYSLKEDVENIVIFNPFFSISQLVYDKIKNEINKITNFSGIIVFADVNEVPIAYAFPNSIPLHEARYLSFLSAMSAELDASFLRNCFFLRANCIYLREIYLNRLNANNSFNYNDNYEKIYSWVTDAALKTLMKKNTRSFSNQEVDLIKESDLQKLRKLKHDIPCDVIMPYHAGDALFLILALRNSLSFINKIIISKWYEDIIQDCSSEIQTFPIEVTPYLRDNNSKADEVIFWEIISKMKGPDLFDSFHYYFRPSREYRISDFHLIDHFYFALGCGINTRNELLTTKLFPEINLPNKNGGGFKILIHIEGGWPIKTYPENYFNELVRQFYNNGYKITVLSSKIQKSQFYDVVKYSNLADYKELLATHNLLIGMDSFPVHYAAHVAGVPTICLFGNTKPVNSDARISNHYQYVTGELKCAGCFSFDKCTVNNKNTCDNFPEANQVYKTAVSMLDQLYNKKHTEEDVLINKINEGKLDEAVAIIEAEINTNPDNAEKHFLLGRLNEASENFNEAVVNYRNAASLDLNNIAYKATLADCHIKLNNVDDALGCFMEILKIDSTNTQTLLRVGNILAENGHMEDALRYYNKVLTLEPGNQVAVENIFALNDFE